MDLSKIISNEKLSEHFKSLARDLDVLEPKHPEQIFKTHLEERKNNLT
jgi:26S proteasome regulatory subunit N1